MYKLNLHMEKVPLGEDEGLVFFDGSTGDTHVADEIAADILDCFGSGREVDAVVADMLERYDGDPEQVAADVRAFTAKLVEKGLTAREQATVIREIEKAGKESGTEPDLALSYFPLPAGRP